MLSVYVHWPFCLSKCPYCDFNSHVVNGLDQEVFRRAYRRELEHYAALLSGRSVVSIFIGGGTPSLMSPQTVEFVLSDIARLWTLDKNVEVTMEANPSSAEAGNFTAFRQAGVNRLSLGVQSLDDAALRFLGRAHDVAEAKAAVALAAKTFPRFSFDLIYGYKGQTCSAWQTELREALSLAGGHVSLYQLTIEPHTQFFVREKRGEVLAVAEDDAASMFETTQELTSAAGLPAYEISNHAREGDACRHNLTYWHYDDYIGVGPGAHGRYCLGDGRHAVENARAPDAWLRQVERLGQGASGDVILQGPLAMREALMMGLRLVEGISLPRWKEKFGTSLPLRLEENALNQLIGLGFIEKDEKSLRATSAGLQRLDAVLTRLFDVF